MAVGSRHYSSGYSLSLIAREKREERKSAGLMGSVGFMGDDYCFDYFGFYLRMLLSLYSFLDYYRLSALPDILKKRTGGNGLRLTLINRHDSIVLALNMYKYRFLPALFAVLCTNKDKEGKLRVNFCVTEKPDLTGLFSPSDPAFLFSKLENHDKGRRWLSLVLQWAGPHGGLRQAT